MTAPDKIYVPLTINLLTKRQVLRLDATDVKPISFANENIAYIRKDALLEWAKNMYEKTMTFVSGDSVRDNEIQMFALRIVKHIESL